MDAVNNYTQINDFSAEKRSPAAIIIRISIPQLYSIYVIRYFIIALYCYSNNGARRVFQFFYHRRVHNSASSTRSIRVRYYFFRIQSLRRLCPRQTIHENYYSTCAPDTIYYNMTFPNNIIIIASACRITRYLNIPCPQWRLCPYRYTLLKSSYRPQKNNRRVE